MIEVKLDTDDKQFPVRVWLGGYKKPFKLTVAAAKELHEKISNVICQYN